MSLRAQVPSGSQIISGFVLDQNGTVIIRAAGPALGAFGVGTAMSDPVLQVWKDNQMIAQNDNWDATTGAAAAAGVGAFPFQAGSKDAAIVMTLAAGAYTAVITDSPASTNRVGREVLLEVYNATVQ